MKYKTYKTKSKKPGYVDTFKNIISHSGKVVANFTNPFQKSKSYNMQGGNY